jgi:uncharacterized membrane protein YfcA
MKLLLLAITALRLTPSRRSFMAAPLTPNILWLGGALGLAMVAGAWTGRGLLEHLPAATIQIITEIALAASAVALLVKPC